MNVSGMLKLMKTLGIGQVYSDPDTQAIFLEFLNLAHDELYRETANLNSDIFIDETHTSLPDQSFITLNQATFSISKVFPIGFKYELEGKSAIEFAEYRFENVYTSDPKIYYKKGNNINFYPFLSGVPYTFNAWSTPERTLLDINTPETAIPYPLSYQSVLVDGALYYLFQDESGFKNPKKEDQALRRWMKGKTDLTSYFKGSNKLKMSTFENA